MKNLTIQEADRVDRSHDFAMAGSPGMILTSTTDGNAFRSYPFLRGKRRIGRGAVWFVLLFATALSLGSCNTGTTGTLAWRAWETNGCRITEIRTAGWQVRDMKSYKSTALGWCHTVYCVRSTGGLATQAAEAPWHFGWCPAPSEMPLAFSGSTWGIELGVEPTFWGASAGIDHRCISALPAEQGGEFQASFSPNHPEQGSFRYKPAIP